jgi:hypothetical protein
VAKVLQLDCTHNTAGVEANLATSPYTGVITEAWIEFDVAFNATWITAVLAQSNPQFVLDTIEATGGNDFALTVYPVGGVLKWAAWLNGVSFPANTPYAPATPITADQFYHAKVHVHCGSPPTAQISIDGMSIGTINLAGGTLTNIKWIDAQSIGLAHAGALVYEDNFRVGTTDGASNILVDDFEQAGSTPSSSIWNSFVDGDATRTDGSGISPPVTPPIVGRVLVAFDDSPLEPTPTWTSIDQGGAFPQSFVSGYDFTTGRQTLLAQTDTGSAIVYINDHVSALFDPRNASSPYFGKLDGRQILLQLYDPIAATWEPQWRGHIDNVSYDIDATASNANGEPINASIQLECVDIFDYLAGYGLTPGLDGVMPTPSGMEDGVYYAATSGTNDDRIIEVLADVGIDSSRSIVFSGNNKVQEVKYDPDESALIALRDAADAEIPFIANLYVDRFGRVVFHGRYGRFDPIGLAADTDPSRWDFHYWKLGDGKAVAADATRTQIRVLSYSRGRSEVVNVAISYPANMPASQMASQVYADTTSITDYGKHSAPPLSDLLVATAVFDSTGRYPETLKYAELLVKNQKDPRESITAIQLQSINPATPRAANVWQALTLSDVSDMVNVKVGYPSGTGFAGGSTADDYFIEGRQMQVRPANAAYDYVTLDLSLSPYVWSADTHGVFPPRT